MVDQTDNTQAMIEAVGLSKYYGEFAAARDVTFSVPRGRVCAFTDLRRWLRLGVEEKEHDVYQMLELAWGYDQRKTHRYGELLRAMMEDQIAWIQDHNHARRITGQNGRDSLALAVAAHRLAHLKETRSVSEGVV